MISLENNFLLIKILIIILTKNLFEHLFGVLLVRYIECTLSIWGKCQVYLAANHGPLAFLSLLLNNYREFIGWYQDSHPKIPTFRNKYQVPS